MIASDCAFGVRCRDMNNAKSPLVQRRPLIKPPIRNASIKSNKSEYDIEREKWSLQTEQLVAAASLPFSILVLPQVVQNVINMSAGNSSALQIISWEGYLSGLLGNTLMATHFAHLGSEKSAIMVQIIGIVNNLAVLLQVTLASFMPLPAFVATLALTSFSIGACLLKLKHHNNPTPSSSLLWSSWQLLVGSISLAVVSQIVTGLLVNHSLGVWPSIATLISLACFAIAQITIKGEQGLAFILGPFAAQLPGWTATLLFALCPLPQLIRNFLEPHSLAGLSVFTMLFALSGNALMVPRAFFINDKVWMVGSTWAVVAGFGQIAGMCRGGQLEPLPFALVFVALAAYLSFSANANAKFSSAQGTSK
jgi:hypothetical protein